MKIYSVKTLCLLSLLLLPVSVLHADEEQDLIAKLSSSAGPAEKCTACVRLRIVGTKNSVAPLAVLLLDQGTAHAARYALEGLPFPEAVTAMRETLPRANGLLKVGLIDSLGRKKDKASVPLLIPLLSDKEATIASASVSALSRIGGKDAVSALMAIRDKATPEVRPAVWNGLLQCSETLLAEGDKKGAIKIYESLSSKNLPERIQIAAWRGTVLADADHRVKLVTTALTGADQQLQTAAVQILRELKDGALVKALERQWATLSGPAQLAVLDAQIKLGADVLPHLRTALESPHQMVRVAATRALGDFGDTSTIQTLAQIAQKTEPAERDAARDSLARLHGTGVREAMLARIDKADPPEKALLLRAVGDRDDTAATDVLLKNASSGDQSVRVSALDSLRKLAIPDTAVPLLRMAAASRNEDQAQPVLGVLFAIAQNSSEKEKLSSDWVEVIKGMPATERVWVLPVLSELGTPGALEGAQSLARDSDITHAKAAVEVLAQWPNAAPAPGLLELANSSHDSTLKILALRGCIAVAGQEPDLKQRLEMLQKAFNAATRPDEKKQALGQMGQIPTQAALEAVMAHLTDPGLTDEAGLAAVAIAEKLAKSNPKLAKEVGEKVLAESQHPEILRRASALVGKPAGGGSFIQDWLVSGPYRQAGADGAEAVFGIAFAPEKPAEKVQWKPAPRGDMIDLAMMFPGEMNCAAYLKARLISTVERQARLLVGSDDGVKAWFNGLVVHSNNVDRGITVDQDIAAIHLLKGTNELMLKITQGGGGWAACARITAQNGQSIKGIQIEPADAIASAQSH